MVIQQAPTLEDGYPKHDLNKTKGKQFDTSLKSDACIIWEKVNKLCSLLSQSIYLYTATSFFRGLRAALDTEVVFCGLCIRCKDVFMQIDLYHVQGVLIPAHETDGLTNPLKDGTLEQSLSRIK